MPSVTNWLQAWSDLTRTQFEVKLDPLDISGMMSDSGAVLRIPLAVSPDNWGPVPVLVALQGWLKLGDVPANARGLHAPMQTRHPNYGRLLEVPVTFMDLTAAEQRRGSRDLVCHLTLSGIANLRYMPRMDYQGAQEVVSVGVSDNGGIQFAIPREHWLKVLTDCGFARSRLIELPMAVGPGEAEWRTCVAKLESATNEARLGHFEQAIGICRQVVEGIVTVIAKHWGVIRRPGQGMSEWLKELEGRIGHVWPEDEEAAVLLTAVFRAVWSWTSPTHHYGSRIPAYAEAAFAVELTAGMLMHAGHLLRSHPGPIEGPSSG